LALPRNPATIGVRAGAKALSWHQTLLLVLAQATELAGQFWGRRLRRELTL
jgi:hypothetical protein